MAKKLMLHAGGREVSFDEVLASITPEATETHVPIPHGTLINIVKDRLPAYNLRIKEGSEHHALVGKGESYFGLFQVENLYPIMGEASHSDYGLTLGIRNDHYRKYPAGLVVGSHVFVCDNLAFSGEVKVGRRHTKNILRDLPLLTDAAFGKLVTARIHQEKRIETYKQTELVNSQAHDIIAEMFFGGALNKTRLAKALTEWRNPSHPEFKERTAWRLMNAVTEVSKGLNPFELSNRTIKMHPILDAACGLVVGSTEFDNPLADVVDSEFVAV